MSYNNRRRSTLQVPREAQSDFFPISRRAEMMKSRQNIRSFTQA
jgi:hypothetical protein